MRIALLVVPLLVLAIVPLAGAAPDVAVCVLGKVGVQPCPGTACVWTAAKATCVPKASAPAVPTSLCHGQRVGFEGYEEWCVNPTNPHCLIEETVWTGADQFSYCTGV